MPWTSVPPLGGIRAFGGHVILPALAVQPALRRLPAELGDGSA